MGQDMSKAFTPPPISFRDCFVDGRVDVAKFTIYAESMNEEELFETNEFSNNNERKRSQEESVTASSKKARSIKNIHFYAELMMAAYVKQHLKTQHGAVYVFNNLLLEKGY